MAAPAQLALAGALGPTRPVVVVGLAQDLGPVWSQSLLVGVCKLMSGKYCEKDQGFS